MAEASIGSDYRQRLLQLLDDLHSRARSATCETESLGCLVAEISFLDPRKARSVAAYLNKVGYVGDAFRLREGCSHNMMLREKGGAAILVNVSPELLPATWGESQRTYRQHGKSAFVLPARTRFA